MVEASGIIGDSRVMVGGNTHASARAKTTLTVRMLTVCFFFIRSELQEMIAL